MLIKEREDETQRMTATENHFSSSLIKREESHEGDNDKQDDSGEESSYVM